MIPQALVGVEDTGEMDRGSPERGLAWSEVPALSASLIEMQAEGACYEKLGGPFPRAHPETAALLQQRWVGLQEGTAAVLVLRHGHRAQVNKIKAVAPLALLDDHTPATKPGERPWPVGPVATQSLVPSRRRSRWSALCSGV